MTKIAILFMALISLKTAWGQEKPAEKPPLEISGRIYANFQYELTENPDNSASPDSHRNKKGFDVDRSYLQANYKFDDNWNSILLLDVTRDVRTVSGAETVETSVIYLRNAYIQFSDKLFERNARFRFGMQPTLYSPFLEGVSGVRWLFKTMADQSFSSIGFGTQSAGASYMFAPCQTMEVSAMVHNGYEGIARKGNTDNGLAGDESIHFKLVDSSEGTLRKAGVLLFHSDFQHSDTPADELNSNAAALYLTTDTWTLIADTIETRKRDADQFFRGQSVTVVGNFGSHGVAGRYYSGNDNFKTLLTSGTKVYKEVVSYAYFYKFIPKKLQTGIMLDVMTTDRAEINEDKQVAWWKWELQF